MSKGRVRRVLLSLLFLLILAAAAAYFFVFLLVRPNSTEMSPALFPGDTAVALRLAEPARGDLIAFEHPQQRGVIALRRVIALPGETVALRAQKVVVNGAELPRTRLGKLTLDDAELPGTGRTVERWREELPGGRSIVILLDPRRRSHDLGPLEVKDGYFVLADSRNHGRDSREYGVIPRGRVRGVVRYLLSAAPVKGIEPRGTQVQ